MKAYVINLPRAIDRRDAIQKEFENYEIDFEFFTGVDWLDLTEHDIRENVEPKFLQKSKNSLESIAVYGTLACWLSHRNLWKFTVEGEVGNIAVFEDDSKLTDETKLALIALNKLEIQNFEFDIIFLYQSKRKKPLIPVHKIDKRFDLNLIKFNSMGAVGYVISRRAMKILLNDYPLMSMSVDELMHWYWLTGLKTYILTPQVVFHGDMNSSLDHHSYSGEADGTNKVREWKITNPRMFKRMRNKTTIRKIQDFPSRLVFKYIPQRLAFRKRMKIESL